ncbi:HAD superfamily hydrolase (TIGR01509 family)/beta-phosphoglucomutase family hydrolase [Arthrobacter sp. SLBN-100]|uniref:beta-phosphoglucomutase family hydrolase n=1 Tax=Arthrobacter sp. SLBN-100 TaxID=2768450 RepID=UPI00114EB2AE|nr:beta-phosphoglucomutase family hydrolase [Arthrobacter sp. SLBN-100]TQJ66374.1 HAD superfamily hydrolase (TIGR01509 family)/beta-phosphoglucomutase family hydrolase [Arthrobacter sp. SLBN-100]
MPGSPTASAALSPFDAVIFDLDGVVTDTASVHEAAWRQLFDGVLTDPRVPADVRADPCTSSDYLNYVDGRPREEGVRAFLESRGMSLPSGHVSDPAGEWTVHGLAAMKDRIFKERLGQQGVRTFPGTVALLRRLRAAGVPVVLATSSRNASAVLAAAGLSDAFDLVMGGVVAGELGLAGKPDPALFLEVVHRLGVPPARAVVIEDAVAGVEAARRGGFGLVVGIDRADRRAELEAAGADVVLTDVSQLDLGRVITDPWHLVYEGYDPAHEGHREALTTVGNGYLAVRGSAPESRRGDVHYPGTYLAGVYNRLTSSVQGQVSEDEHMVNQPNWLVLDVRIEGTDWWSRGGLKIRRERRVLDMRRAILEREVELEAPDGRRLKVRQRRFASMAQPHLAALETVLVAVGWTGPAAIRSGVDTDVTNENVPEDVLLSHRHLVALDPPDAADPLPVTEVQTTQSHVRIATALRTQVSGEPGTGTAGGEAGLYYRFWDVQLHDGVPLAVTKTASVVTSRDRAVSAPALAAAAVLRTSATDFEALLSRHEDAWVRLLRLFEINIEGHTQVQLILNLHVFHLLQALSPHTAELDAGVPARGLHGEGYRGHIFWDELFVLPLLTSRMPSVARSLITYRWRRLPAAREAAAAAGYRGALFPWQSGSDGREETPRWLFNRRSGRWVPDFSHLQRHAGLAVAYNAWQYFLASQDREWLLRHGAELIVEVARCVVSMADYEEEEDRFHLRGVMGPDEYHTGPADNPGAGLDDNAYTNVMAAWVCAQAAMIMATLHGHDLEDLQARLTVKPGETAEWLHVSQRMAVPFHDGIISQFQGYEGLQELDWEHYRNTYRNIERLDLILEAEGDSTNRYRLAKQADVLMLLYVFGEKELRLILSGLGYAVTAAQVGDTVSYYLARTAHGSTLSRVAHASVLAATDPDRAWTTFREALSADLDDTQGGTTSTGIHLGAMAGSIDVVQRSFAGLRITADALLFAPKMPKGLQGVSFHVRYRGHLLTVGLEHGKLTVSAASGDAPDILVQVGSENVQLGAGESRLFVLD